MIPMFCKARGEYEGEGFHIKAHGHNESSIILACK
jgi:hypothetical protein